MTAAPEPVLLTLPDWGVLGVSGADATEFLHGQFTNDLQALPDGRAQLSAYCLPKGQTIANFLIWRNAPDQYRMLLPADVRERVLKRLEMFRMRSNAALEDLSGSWKILGQAGEPTDSGRWPNALPQAPLEVVQADGRTAVRWPGAQPRWVVLVPNDAAAPDAKPDDDLQWRRRDIEEGLPFVRSGSCERFVPQHINLDLLGAVSYSKGCYPGQEVVARMHYRGQIKHRAYRLGCSSESLSPGDEVWPAGDARACGHVVDAWSAPDGDGSEVLASLRLADADRPLHARAADGAALTRLSLPYDLDAPTEE